MTGFDGLLEVVGRGAAGAPRGTREAEVSDSKQFQFKVFGAIRESDIEISDGVMDVEAHWFAEGVVLASGEEEALRNVEDWVAESLPMSLEHDGTDVFPLNERQA